MRNTLSRLSPEGRAIEPYARRFEDALRASSLSANEIRRPMACCQCQGTERLFDRREAQRKLHAYARHGPDWTTRLLLDAVRATGVEGATLLDIGGGAGVAQLELLAAGVRSATDVDASSAYLDVAHEEAQRRGYGDRVSYRHGDFVAVSYTHLTLPTNREV